MPCLILAFLAGISVLQTIDKLPSKNALIILLVFIGVVQIIKKKFLCHSLFLQLINIFSGLIIGIVWSAWFAHSIMSWTLPKNLEGQAIPITGYINSIPHYNHDQARFTFLLPQSIQVQLSWENPPPNLKVGDQWHLLLKLKRIHGMKNPGGFDYEAWALQTKIRAQGYVVYSNNNNLIASHWYHSPLNRFRQFLKDKIIKNLPQSNTSQWVLALTIGERQDIPAEDWQILRNTGTNHLMAIAGLHIGFLCGFTFWLVNFFWKRFPVLMLILPAQHAGWIAALVASLLYSALSGFSIPTQRAFIMLCIFSLSILLRQRISSWQGFWIALFGVLIINPLTVSNDSFWLSFCSVALIVYGMSARLSPQGLWWKLGRIQWVLSLGLIPFGVWLFQECSLISFIANSIAIPLVGFIIEPLVLLGSVIVLFSDTLGSPLLKLADKALGVLWKILVYFSDSKLAAWQHSISQPWILVLSVFGIFILLYPKGFPGRAFGLIAFMPLFFLRPFQPSLGEYKFTLLDVGQGLSAVLQTHSHVLVFDTGANYNNHFDLGENVVTPFLHTLNLKKIDMLVISHGDNDHIGGSEALLKNFSINSIKTSVPEKFKGSANYCLEGEAWNWDGVHFEFLYPGREQLGLGNNSSCVLRVTSKSNKSLLLTGDIEKMAEKILINHHRILSSEILIAPHHGSKTSAEDDFLKAINPKIVLFPIGYRNRYHFPHKLVVKKYSQHGIKQFNTVKSGAIEYDSQNDKLSFFRLMHKHYWND